RRGVEEAVVEGAAVELVDAGDEPDAVLARDLAQPIGRRAGDLDGVGADPREDLLCPRVGPAGERTRPDRGRIHGHEGLREDDELRAGPGGLARKRGELVERRLAVEYDRLGLDAGDLDGLAHRREPNTAMDWVTVSSLA